MNKVLTAACVLLIGLSACKKEKQDPGGTGAESMSDEWYTTLTQNGADVFGLGHFKITTYNSSTGLDSLWIDDGKNSWGFKCKVGANFSNLTFGKASALNQYYNPASPAAFPQTVSFTNGKILQQAGRSRSGNITDSIYVEVEFSDDPGTKYVVSGHARTKLAEDEY